MSTQRTSAIRRTFFRGIYEILTYLLPGLLILYLLYVLGSIESQGWSAYVNILIGSPSGQGTDGGISLFQGLNISSLILILLVSYITGQLSYPFRWVTRKIWYTESRQGHQHYSALKIYFDIDIEYEGEQMKMHEKIISDIGDFTNNSQIKKIDEVIDTIEDDDTTTEEVGEDAYLSRYANLIGKLNQDYLPAGKFCVIAEDDDDAMDMRRSYRIVKRFIEYTYPEFYHRGYERYTGLLRFWETVFPIGTIFIILSTVSLFHSNSLNIAVLVLFISISITLTAVYRIRIQMLYPYREIFNIFYLHKMGYLESVSGRKTTNEALGSNSQSD